MSAVIRSNVESARRLTERIRVVALGVSEKIDKLKELVQEAKESEAHLALGYSSWTAYLADVLGETPMRLERDVRQELVAELTAQGMSTRAIAPIVGASKDTVHRDRAGVSSDTPAEPVPSWSPETGFNANPLTGEVIDQPTTVAETHTIKTVTGLDGKAYPAAEPSKPQRRALADQARDAGWNLRKAVERLQRIEEDDRFLRNKEEVATHLRGHLMFAVEVCQDLLDATNQSQED